MALVWYKLLLPVSFVFQFLLFTSDPSGKIGNRIRIGPVFFFSVVGGFADVSDAIHCRVVGGSRTSGSRIPSCRHLLVVNRVTVIQLEFG